nr:uncharacterized protein LOC123759390 isoform X1 [Procambarus clarkii]
MGLTESNQSKAAAGWGPSKSRSTPHFPDGRSYQNRPRQAATLPARPTPDSSHPPPYNLPRTPIHDPGAMGHDPRPPETVLCRRNGSSLADRSPGHRSMPPRRSASADSVKRRSDPLLDSGTLKQTPQMKPHQCESFTVLPSHRPPISPPSSPRQNCRPRPTAIYVADDQAAHLVRHREGRPRERGHSRGPHAGTRGLPGEEGRERARSSCERRQRGVHVSTMTLAPVCPGEPGDDQPRPAPRHHRRKKKETKKARERVEYSASEGLQGDPYVCLHYGGTLHGGQRQQVQQVTAWRTDHEEENVSSPNNQLSQVVIRMNQVSATTLDNYDAVNANVECVQVRRNVWFHANRTTDVGGESVSRTAAKVSSSPALSDNTTLDGQSETEIIRWPDVTSKVSSIYMRPEMHIAAVSCIEEGQEATSGRVDPAGSHTTTSCRTSSGASEPAHLDSSGRDRESVRIRALEKQGAGNSGHGTARQFSIYDDRRNYSKAPGRRKNKSVLVSIDLQKSEEERLVSVPSCNSTHVELSSRFKDEPPTDCVVVKHSRSPDESREQTDNYVECSSNVQDDPYDGGSPAETLSKYLPPSKIKIEHNLVGSQRTEVVDNNDTFPDNLQSNDAVERLPDNFWCQNNIDNLPNKSLHNLELKNHDEDYVMEENREIDNYYVCGDNEQEPVESCTVARGRSEPVSLSRGRSGSVREESVCEAAGDNVPVFCDSVDKDVGADSHWCGINSSLCAWSGPEEVTGCSPSGVKDTPEGASDTRVTHAGNADQHLHKDQCPLQCNICSTEDQYGCVDQSESRAYIEALQVLKEKYWADTVSEFPSALSRSHQCLNKSTSLPRNLQCTNPSATHSITAENKMKGFRNRFRSLDVSNFSVLRLPLGNQPRLVDVLRGTSTQGELSPDPPQGTIPGHECHVYNTGKVHKLHSGDECVSDADSSCDGVTLVSYSQCWPSPPLLARETRGNGCDTLVGGESDAAADGEGVGSPVCDDPGAEGEPHLFLEDSDVATIKKSDARELQVGREEEEERRWPGNDPNGHSWKPAQTRRRGNTIGGGSHTWHSLSENATHTWHPGTGGQGVRPCSIKEQHVSLPQVPTALPNITTDFPITEEVDFLDMSHPPGRHAHKKWNRPSVHSIAWDTPWPAAPDCSYTCHEQCQDLVTLDCKAELTPDSQTNQDDICIENTEDPDLHVSDTQGEEEDEEEEEEVEVDEDMEEELEDCQEEQEEKHEEEQQEKEMKDELFKKCEEVSTLRKTVNRLQSHLVDNETLEAWVERYNATAQGLQIAKEDDGSFRGCIRVHLNLSRPINIVAGTRPPSIYDILQEDRTMEKTLTSFYMPRDAVKAIHITSNTTTREVIIALLRKFKVVDNPQKFALYERTYDTAQSVKAKLRRLGDLECPLVLALNWSAGGLTNKRLVLQENDTADIQWEAFSLPELSNFLRILDREEEEYRCQIQDKYSLLRRRIGNILLQNQQVKD